MSEQKNFLGIPVHGDITSARSRTEQKPLEELAPLLQAVLDDPTIHSFGWDQHTPYFNDGDPCVFSTGDCWFRTVEQAENEELEDWELEIGSNEALGEVPYRYNRETGKYEDLAYEGPDEARYRRCKALAGAISGYAFEDALLEAFGDHAQITVRRDRIDVEFYEHD